MHLEPPLGRLQRASTPSYRLTANVGQSARQYPLGTPLTVLYRANDPSDALVSSTLELYFGAILPAILASVALVRGIAFVVVSR